MPAQRFRWVFVPTNNIFARDLGVRPPAEGTHPEIP